MTGRLAVVLGHTGRNFAAGMFERHLHYANSAVAWRILDDWETYLPRFIKVMPVDYKQALAAMQANQSRPPQPTKQRPIKVTREISHG